MALHDSRKTQSRLAGLLALLCVILLICLLPYSLWAAKDASTDTDIAVQLAGLIADGQFDRAEKMIDAHTDASARHDPVLARFDALIDRYREIEKARRASRQVAYEEELAKLERYETGPAEGEQVDPNDPNNIDLDDPNDVRTVLAVVARAREFADEDQKEQLLNDPYVKKAVQNAIDDAAAFQVEGKWLEAYANCYGWLSNIEPNNEAYSDYAEQLLDKAEIAASFEDSPCESSEERYAGVKKEMFTLAVYALSMDYVQIPDYRKMATRALRRCRLLGEVLSNKMRFPDPVEDANDAEKHWFTPPGKQQLAAWLSAVKALQDEVDQAPAGFARKDFLSVFEKALNLNEATAELPQPILIAQFTEGAFGALDQYTTLVWPRQVEEFEKNMMNEFTGIGVEISKRTGQLTVASLLPDTPAYRAGLDAGDVIVSVDGLPTKDMSLLCAVRKITGPKGTKVNLTVTRPATQKTREVVITRDRIIIPTIRGWKRSDDGDWLYLIDEQHRIGYVRITSFSGETEPALEKVLDELEAKGLEGLILDVRANPGGLLSSAVAVADKFLEDGLIVRTQPRSGFRRWPSYESAHKKDTHPNYPLVILIDSSSASGSEILAGALGDEKYNRAVLVGERTHGKGSVQSATPYPGGGSRLKYTMAYYHLPSDQRVMSKEDAEQRGTKDWGVGPDVEVVLRSDELRKLVDLQRENDVLMQADNGEIVHENNRHSLEDTIDADPQLAVALLVAKAKVLAQDSVKLASEK